MLFEPHVPAEFFRHDFQFFPHLIHVAGQAGVSVGHEGLDVALGKGLGLQSGLHVIQGLGEEHGVGQVLKGEAHGVADAPSCEEDGTGSASLCAVDFLGLCQQACGGVV